MKLLIMTGITNLTFTASAAVLEEFKGHVSLPCYMTDKEVIAEAHSDTMQNKSPYDYIMTSDWRDKIYLRFGSMGNCISKIGNSSAYFVLKSQSEYDWIVNVTGTTLCQGFCNEQQKREAWAESLSQARNEAIFACGGSIDETPLELNHSIEFIFKYISQAVFRCSKNL